MDVTESQAQSHLPSHPQSHAILRKPLTPLTEQDQYDRCPGPSTGSGKSRERPAETCGFAARRAFLRHARRRVAPGWIRPSYMDSSMQVFRPGRGNVRRSAVPAVAAAPPSLRGLGPPAGANENENTRRRIDCGPISGLCCGDLGLRATMTVAHRRPFRESASGAPEGTRPEAVSVGSRRHVVRSSPEQSLRPGRITRRRMPRLGSTRPKRAARACWPPRR